MLKRLFWGAFTVEGGLAVFGSTCSMGLPSLDIQDLIAFHKTQLMILGPAVGARFVTASTDDRVCR